MPREEQTRKGGDGTGSYSLMTRIILAALLAVLLVGILSELFVLVGGTY